MSEKKAPQDYESVQKLIRLVHRRHDEGVRIHWHTMLSVSIQKYDKGYWHNSITIRFSRDGEVKFTRQEPSIPANLLAHISEEFGQYDLPEAVGIPLWSGDWRQIPNLPEPPRIAKDNTPHKVWAHLRKPTPDERHGGWDCPVVVALEVRFDPPDGSEKIHNTWTLYSDQRWYKMAPDDFDYLWGTYEAEQRGVASMIVVHEGAKAAQLGQQRVDEHSSVVDGWNLPEAWHRFLQHSVHVGWVGGVGNASQVNWSRLVQLAESLHTTRILIVPDNDRSGKRPLRSIARGLSEFTGTVEFIEWAGAGLPHKWDFGDKIPLAHWDKQGRYTKPNLQSRLRPMIWATREYEVERGHRQHAIRDEFLNVWHYHTNDGHFYSTYQPDQFVSVINFDRSVRWLSDVRQTSDLYFKEQSQGITKLVFRPESADRVLVVDGHNALNQWIDSRPPAIPGDTTTFWKFFQRAVPNERERTLLINWMATLMLHPGRMMNYAILQYGKQGTGKGLTVQMLEAFLGDNHTTRIRENDLKEGKWTSFMHRTVLATCPEIYQGASWTTYHQMKDLITGDAKKVNIKYGPEFKAEVRTKYMLATNEEQALLFEDDDRRFLVIRYTDDKLKGEEAAEFVNWFSNPQSLAALRHELEVLYNGSVKDEESIGYLVPEGSIAPMTEHKVAHLSTKQSRLMCKAL